MRNTPARGNRGDQQAIEAAPIRARDGSTRSSVLRRAAPIAAFVLASLAIGGLASRTAGGYPTPPSFHLFFSDTIHMKVWLTAGAVGLAVFQILTAGACLK